MKPPALLVSTSRAGLIEPGALVAGLQAGRPALAAIDVVNHEPATDASTEAMDNVVATPHLGYVALDEWGVIFAAVFEQINAFAAGRPVHLVNPEALTRGRSTGT